MKEGITRDQRIEWLHDLEALAANPAWVKFSEELAKLSAAEAEAHEDEKRTPQERAEHLHSMKLLRDLAGDGAKNLGWLAVQIRRTKAALQSA